MLFSREEWDRLARENGLIYHRLHMQHSMLLSIVKALNLEILKVVWGATQEQIEAIESGNLRHKCLQGSDQIHDEFKQFRYTIPLVLLNGPLKTNYDAWPLYNAGAPRTVGVITDQLRSLGREIKATEDWSLMPILADCLEEHDWVDLEIYRDPQQPWYKGCWILETLTSNSEGSNDRGRIQSGSMDIPVDRVLA